MELYRIGISLSFYFTKLVSKEKRFEVDEKECHVLPVLFISVSMAII